MADQNFGKRLLELGWGGLKDTASDYFSNVSSIKSDADTIKSQLIQDGKSVVDVFERMKKSGKSPVKKIRDWFYSNEMGMGGFGDDTDDFDAGFKPDSADDKPEADTSRTLSADDMTDIAKKQSGEAYKIASKQADLHIANTAEIVSAINSRSAEQTAAINKVNDTLTQISKKLDGMIGYMATADEKKKTTASIFDSNGNLSLTGMFNAGRETVAEKAEMLEMAKTFSMILTPQFVAQQGIDKLLSQKIDAIGDRSIKDISERLDSAIGDSIQNGLMALVKNSTFNDLFGIGDASKNVNYQKFVTNSYDTKPAVFDGMTRQTIVHIIPEYLKSIESAITGGAPKSINEKGQLSTKQENYFQSTVGKSIFGGTTLDYGDSRSLMMDKLRSDSNYSDFSSAQLETAARALKSGFVMILLNGVDDYRNNNDYRRNANAILSPKEIQWGFPTTNDAVSLALYMLTAESGKGEDYWIPVLRTIVTIISSDEREARKFAAKCTDAAASTNKRAESFARTHSHKHQAGNISKSLVFAAFHDVYTDRLGTESSGPSITAQNPSTKPTPVSAVESNTPIQSLRDVNQEYAKLLETYTLPALMPTGRIGSAKDDKNGLTISEYLGDIFGILNRGLNVYVVGTAKGKGPGPYKNYTSNIKQGSTTGSVQQAVAQSVAPITNAASAVNNVVNTITGHDPADDAVIPEDPAKMTEEDIENIDEQIKELEEELNATPAMSIGKRKSLKKRIKRLKLAKSGKTEERKTVRSVTTDAKSKASDMLSSVTDAVEETEVGRKVLRNKNVKKGIGWFKTKAKSVDNALFGEETDEVDEEGNPIHGEGLVDKAQEKLDKTSARVNKRTNSIITGFFNKRAKKMDNTKLLGKVNDDIKDASELAKDNLDNANKSGDETSRKNAEEDAQSVSIINSLINIAQHDGELGQSEQQSLTASINSLHSKELKAKYTRYALPMLKKMKSERAVANGDLRENIKNQKGIVSTFISQIAKFSGMIFKPITTLLGNGLKVLFGISGIMFKIAGKLAKSGARDVFYGAKSLGAGLFGSRKEGEESIGMLRRILFLPDRLFKTFNALTKNFLTKLASTVDVVSASITKLAAAASTKIGNFIGNQATKLNNLLFGEEGLLAKFKDSAFAQNLSGKLTGLGEKISAAGGMPIIGQFTDFAKGFTSAFREKREAKANASMDALVKRAPTTKTEAETQKIRVVFTDFIKEFKDIWNDQNALIGTIIQNQEDTKAVIEGANDSGEEGGPESSTPESSTPESASSETRNKPAEGGNESTPESAANPAVPRTGSGNTAVPRTGLGNRIRDLGGAITEGIRGKGTMGLDLGKMLGGITSILGGIGKMFLSAILSLSGVKAIMSTFQSLFTESVKPLNATFQKVAKILKPVVSKISESISLVAEVISNISSNLVDAIAPILTDIVGPLMEQIAPIVADLSEVIGELIAPILKTILGSVLMPLLTKTLAVVVPCVEIIAAAIKGVLGSMEIIVGLIVGLGGLVTSLAMIGNSKGAEVGSSMMGSAGDLISNGWILVKQAIGTSWNIAKDVFSSVASSIKGETDEEKEEPVEEKPVREKEPEKMQGSILEGYMGNGDVTNNYYNTSTGQVGDINNMYGSGEAQGAYGAYLGMGKHGCGPTALADATARRTGSRVSASGLARSMAGSGLYSPSRGTSVGGFISASRAMGADVRPGGVTSASLKRASGNNPVTLFGSGSGFGTKQGNNHYVNVVGSNGRGISYVSNPLTGRVERRSTSDLVRNSVLGLYGSGDANSGDYYTFPEAVQEAMNELKGLAKQLLGMFTGNNDEDMIEESVQKERNEQAIKEAKAQLGDEWDEYETRARELAYADYESKHPKLDSETDDEYLAKQEKYYQENQMKYLGQADVFKNAEDKAGNIFKNILDSGDGTVSGYKAFSSSSFTMSGGSSGIYGEEGKGSAKMFDFGTPTHLETNITSGESGESPVHDFFGATAGSKAYSSSNFENWFKRRQSPDKTGTGTSGGSHYGLDIQWEGGNAGKPLHAITSGTVTDYRYSESGGNMIRWRDSSNKYEHVYMHMMDLPANLRPGDVVNAGDLVGHVGNTGASGGAHLHYGIYPNSSSWTADVNPLTYWKFRKGTDLPGDTNRDKIWAYLVAPTSAGGLGLTKAAAAGILANMKEESKFEPRREEGNYADPITNTSYVEGVDSGTISRSQFENDKKGFGLVQWTPQGRKTKLFSATKGQGVSVGDMVGQLDYFKSEMEEDYPTMLSNMRTNTSLTYAQAMEDFLRKFEVPADIPGNVVRRTPYAKEIYEYYENKLIPTSLSNSSDSLVEESFQKPQSAVVGSGSVNGAGSVIINNPGDAARWEALKPKVGDLVDLSDNVKISGIGNKEIGWLDSYGPKTGWTVKAVNSNGTLSITNGTRTFTIKSSYAQKAASSEIVGPAITKDTGTFVAGDTKNKSATTTTTTKSVEQDMIDHGLDPNYRPGLGNKSGLTGSGDESFIESFVGSADAIPPINDGPDSVFWNEVNPSNNGLTTVNQYNITRTSDKYAEERLNKILNHTFEVSSKTIESKLQQILDRMEEKRSGSISVPSSVNNTNLFTEQIPSQVSRLSIG